MITIHFCAGTIAEVEFGFLAGAHLAAMYLACFAAKLGGGRLPLLSLYGGELFEAGDRRGVECLILFNGEAANTHEYDNEDHPLQA